MATNSIERFKNWITEAVEGESPRLTKSASATPEASFKFSSNPLSLSVDNKEQKADPGIRQNLLSAFSTSNLLDRLAKSPLVNKKIRTYITRSQTRSRLYEYYGQSDETVSSVPSTPPARLSVSTSPARVTASTPPARLSASTSPARSSASTSPARVSASTPPARVSVSTSPARLSVSTSPSQISASKPPARVSALTPPARLSASTTPARVSPSSPRAKFNERQASNSLNSFAPKDSDSSYSLDHDKIEIAHNDSNHRVLINAQNEHLTSETKQKFDRQDSGFTNSTTSRESINSLNKGDNGAIDVFEEVLDYSTNVSDYIESEQIHRRSVRDPFRVVRRPSKKATRNRISHKLSVNDYKLSTAGHRNQKNDRNIPKLKISIQYFQSSEQIRVMLTDIKNLNQLCQTDGNIKIHAKVCLLPRKRQKKSTKKREACSNFMFNDIFYYHNVDFEELQAMVLRIHIYENKRRWSRAEKIGGVLIPLENFDFCFDTSMWCKILNKDIKNEDTDDALFEIIPAIPDVMIDADPIPVTKDLAASYPYTLRPYSLETPRRQRHTLW